MLIKINYDCPLCEEEHEVIVKTTLEETDYKGEIVQYEDTVYICERTEEEFTPSKIMTKNLLNIINSYRKKKGLLTSSELIEIREYYNLTQKEFANSFGWGDITIQRYEKKLVQDETYDQIIRRAYDEPLYLLEQIKNHKNNFEITRFVEITQNIKSRIKEKDNFYYNLKEIENNYVEFDTENDFNGNKLLDLEKTKNIISYFSEYIDNLYKVKLMKLLWYADVLNYKLKGCSMTGLVYRHLPYGAVPISHEELLKMDSIIIEEEFIGDHIGYKIKCNKNINIKDFDFDEIQILNKIIGFFKDKKTSDIVHYMHEEIGYKETNDNEIIPYSLASKIKDF